MEQQTARRSTTRGLPDDLERQLARLVWGYRWEIAAAIPPYVAFFNSPGPLWVSLLCYLGALLIVLEVFLTPARRQQMAERRQRDRFRYALDDALGHLGLPRRSVRTVRSTASGFHASVLLPPGIGPGALVDHTETLAATLRARSVAATVSTDDAAIVELICATGEDPLARPLDTPWPGLAGTPSVVNGQVPVGVSSDGEVVSITLWSRHVLAAGLPRSGKSAFLTMLLTYAMGDPSCQIVVLDPKGRDFRWASERCHVASTQAEAARMLRSLVVEMDRRNAEQPGRKADGVSPGHRPILVFADELAELTALGVDRRLDDECSNLLRRLAAVGPSAGISLVVATQRPSADLVPTSLRSLFSWLVCMRVQRPADAAIILGELQPGVEPHRIPRDPTWAGVGYITKADGRCVKVRTWYLPDDQIIRTTPSGFEGMGSLLAGAAEAHGLALAKGRADRITVGAETSLEVEGDKAPPRPPRRRR